MKLWSNTLFARLFLLLWGTLVISHAAAFLLVTQVVIPLTAPPVTAHGADHARSPLVFPSLPPVGSSEHVDLPSGHAMPGLPLPLLLLDYAIRLLVMGLGAWWGSRWLTQPVSRLVQAAQQMNTALAQGKQPLPMDASRGTVEAQQAATVFNQLAMDLYKEFRSRELLFATVSHDLRTPMTRMRLRLESQPGPSEISQCINDIAEMDALVRSALAMVRQHHASPSLQATRIDAVVQAVVDDFVEAGARVDWPDAATTPPVTALADPTALRRVLVNVIQNALRHASSVRIALRVESHHDAVTVLLDDDGPGIAEVRLAHVFEPRMGPPTADGGNQGNGLGLYIAQDLMQRQGGSIALNNRSEGGLRVTVSLPLLSK